MEFEIKYLALLTGYDRTKPPLYQASGNLRYTPREILAIMRGLINKVKGIKWHKRHGIPNCIIKNMIL